MKKHFSETTGGQRLVYGLACGVAVAAMPLPLGWEFRVLLAWCVGLGVYLGLAWWLCHSFDAERTRERVQAQDEPSVALFFILLLANLACVAAISVLMQQSRDLSGLERALHVGLSVAALAVSWLFIQTIFAIHYAHRYYQDEKQREPDGAKLLARQTLVRSCPPHGKSTKNQSSRGLARRETATLHHRAHAAFLLGSTGARSG